MVNIEVVIKDAKSNVILQKRIESKDPQKAAEKFSKKYPDCFVLIYLHDKNNVISISPENMKKDQELLDSGEISVNEFMKRWFPGKRPSKRDVVKDLVEEFGEEELI